MDRGVIYVAYGQSARAEAMQSIASLKARHDLPVMAITDAQTIKGADHLIRFGGDEGWGARRAKLHVDKLAPWEHFLYIDADTRVNGDLGPGFEILADGWDMVITPSGNQETNRLWHVDKEDKALTLMDNPLPLQLQGGLFWAAKNDRTAALFEAWRQEWAVFSRQDQGALLRAIHREPVRLWLLGECWQEGQVIDHRWGRARA